MCVFYGLMMTVCYRLKLYGQLMVIGGSRVAIINQSISLKRQDINDNFCSEEKLKKPARAKCVHQIVLITQ